jgi:hypothetical protein
MFMLHIAFKEWAVICRALAEGRQSLILRKGGIQEKDGVFRVEQERFWLFPTYLHQSAAGIVPTAQSLLADVERTKPPADKVALSVFVEVTDIFHLESEEKALALADLHIWSEATVRQRFHYRQPGLFVLGVRTFTVPIAHAIAMTPYYEGCKSWVELAVALPTANATAVLDEAVLHERRAQLRARL